MKQCTSKAATAIVAAAMLSVIIFPRHVQAEETPLQLPIKVGDRIETRGIVTSKGTITEIGTGEHKGMYRVRGENRPPSDQGDWISPHGVQGYMFLLGPNDSVVGDVFADKGVRSSNDGNGGDRIASSKHQSIKEPAAASGVGVPAKRTPISEPQQKKVTSGAPSPELAKKMIQYLWEGMSDDYSKINADVSDVVIGKPRLWQQSAFSRDIGSGIPGVTKVYPVHAKWIKRTYSHSQIVIVEQEGVCNFYINAFNKWQCGLAESKDLKPLRSIDLLGK